MIKYKYDLHFGISAVELKQIHQHFVPSLVILVFAGPPSFIPVPKQTFYLLAKALIYV